MKIDVDSNNGEVMAYISTNAVVATGLGMILSLVPHYQINKSSLSLQWERTKVFGLMFGGFACLNSVAHTVFLTKLRAEQDKRKWARRIAIPTVILGAQSLLVPMFQKHVYSTLRTSARYIFNMHEQFAQAPQFADIQERLNKSKAFAAFHMLASIGVGIASNVLVEDYIG